MLRPALFEHDPEFQKLLARREDVDLVTAGLECARDAFPMLDFGACQNWIDAQAGALAGPVARAKSDRAAMEAISDHLSGPCRLRGDADHFHDPDCSYLNRVMETGRGIPISLSMLYMAVANRLGVELKGAAAPVHFLTRCETTDGLLFVDAYHAGRILTRDATLSWLSALAKMPRRDLVPTLAEASVRTIILRMLNNLKSLYARQENWQAAWCVQNRLSALQPSSYAETRDLAILAVRTGSPGQAMDLLRALQRDCPASDRESLRDIEREAQSRLAQWN